jgi:hypothetical protein
MPNLRNISKPLLLISYGRSGTSLVQAAFEERGDCFTCGETADLITKIWSGVEHSHNDLIVNVADGTFSTHQHCALAIQSVFLSLFASEKPLWFQKLSVSREWADKIGLIGEDAAADWYWRVITETFPEARCFTILRNPYDVVVSAKAYWNLEDSEIWEAMRVMANFILHPKSRIQHAISFDSLSHSFDEEMRGLCSYLEIVSSPRMKTAKEVRHVPSHLSGSKQQVDHKAGWVELKDGPYVDEALKAIERVWQHFGYQFERKSEERPATGAARTHV